MQKLYIYLLFSLFFAAVVPVAGCGLKKEGEKGGPGQPCYPNDTCDAPYLCENGSCVDSGKDQGGLGQPCYPNDTCDAPYLCENGSCVDSGKNQGGLGQPCYPNDTCDNSYICQKGICEEGACTPDCSGLECGPDPLCQEICGRCDPGFYCDDGSCLETGEDQGGLGQPCYPDDSCDSPFMCEDGICTCESGQILSCLCPEGEEGLAICEADRLSHSSCECGDQHECLDSDISSHGSISTSVISVDFNNSTAIIRAGHKIDNEESEDGCVSEINLVLHHHEYGTDKGCRLELDFGGFLAPDSNWYGGLKRVLFEADEFCPGFNGSTEGIYISGLTSMIPLWYEGPRRVPGRKAPFACAGEVVFVFPDSDFVLSTNDGRTLEMNLGGLEVSGMLFSKGDPSLQCIDLSCPPGFIEEETGWCSQYARGGECNVQNDCFHCPGCRAPYREICLNNLCWLSGTLNEEEPCGDPIAGSYLTFLGLPMYMDPTGFRSAAIRVLHPKRVDGSRLKCEDLMADPMYVDEDLTLNRLRVSHPSLILNASDTVAMPSVSNIPTGDDRLFFVRLHSQNNGQGRLLAAGCTAGVKVDVIPDQRIGIEMIRAE